MIWERRVARIGERRAVYKFLKGKPEGNFEDASVDGRIILIWSSESGMRRMDWIHLAQDKKRWPALVSEVMNLRVP